MNLRQHTPGPWAVGSGERSLRTIECTTPRGLKKAIAQVGGYGGDSREANARLMAAAPELLSALQELRECSDHWSEYDVPLGIVSRIDAAIEKALGVSSNVGAKR